MASGALSMVGEITFTTDSWKALDRAGDQVARLAADIAGQHRFTIDADDTIQDLEDVRDVLAEAALEAQRLQDRLGKPIKPKIDARGILSAFEQTLRALSDVDLDVTITAHDDGIGLVVDEFGRLRKEMEEPIEITIDPGTADSIASDLQQTLRSLSDVSVSATVSVDGSDLQATVDEVERLRRQAEKPIGIDVDSNLAEDDLGFLRDELDGLRADAEAPIIITVDSGSAGEQVSDLADRIKGALNFEAVGSLGEFFTSFEEGGKEARAAMAQLRSQTGATGEELQRLRGEAETLFKKGVGENVSDAIRAIGSAEQQLGRFLDPKGMQDFTVRAAGIGKTFDKEVSEVIGKSRTFISNFGLDGQKAGDLLAFAMQKAGNGMDDVLDSMDEYSQLAKQAGASAEEWVGILVRGVQAGSRDTDKISDSLKELSIRLRAGDTSKALQEIQTPITATIQGIVAAGEAGSKSAFQVAQETAAAIENAFQAGKISETMRSQLQIAIAGTPAEDLGAELYGKIFAAPIDAAQIQAQALQAGQLMTNAVAPTSVFDQIGRGFELVKTKVAEFAAPMISGLGSVLTTTSQIGPAISLAFNHAGTIKKFLPAMLSLLPGFGGVAAGATAAGTAGTAAWSSILGPILPIVAGVALVVGAFVLLYKHSDSFRATIDKLVTRVKEFISRGIERLTPLLTTLGDVFSMIGDIVGELASVYIDALVFQFEVMYDVMSFIVVGIADFIAGLFGLQDAGELVKAVFFLIGRGIDAVKAGLNSFKIALAGIKAGITTFVSEARGALEALFNLDFSGFIDKIANAFESAADSAARARNAQAEAIADEAQRKRFSTQTDDLVGMIKRKALTLEQAMALLKSSAELNQIDLNGQGFVDAKKKLEEAWSGLSELAAEKPPTVTPAVMAPSKPKIKATIIDFKADVQKILDETAALRASIEIAAVDENDPLKRLALEFAERERQILLQNQREKEAAQQKIDDARASAEKGSEIQIKFYQEYLDAISERERVQIEQMRQERKKALNELAEERVDGLFTSDNDSVSREISILKNRQASITAATVDAIRERGRIETEILSRQQDEELDTFLASLPEFRKAAQEIYVSAIAAGTPEALAESDRLIDGLRQRFILGNEQVGYLLEAQSAAMVELVRSIDDKVADARLEVIPGAAARERAKRLQEAERTLRMELALYEGNAQLIAAARIKYQAALYDIDQEYRRRTSLAYAAQYSLLTAAEKVLTGVISDEDRQRIEGQLAALTEREENLLKQLQTDEINYQQYSDALLEIDLERSELQKQLGIATGDFWESTLNASIAIATDSLRIFHDEQLAMMSETVTRLEQMSKAGAAGSAQFWGTQLDLLIDGSIAASTAVGATLLESVVAGKDAAEALKKTVLSSLFSLAEQQIMIFTPTILAAATSLLGPIAGPIAGGIAIAGIKALMAGAKASLKFERGGLVPGGEKQVTVNERGPEFIMNHLSTRANMDVLRWANANPGRSIEQWVIDRHGKLLVEQKPAEVSKEMLARIEKGNATIVNRLDRLETTLSTVTKNSTSVEHHFGEMRWEGGAVTTAVESTTAKELMYG